MAKHCIAFDENEVEEL
jgi:hypothetical protein